LIEFAGGQTAADSSFSVVGHANDRFQFNPIPSQNKTFFWSTFSASEFPAPKANSSRHGGRKFQIFLPVRISPIFFPVRICLIFFPVRIWVIFFPLFARKMWYRRSAKKKSKKVLHYA